MNAQLDFTADHHIVLKEAVQGVVDGALGGVFHRHHTKLYGAGCDFTEDFVNRGHRHADHRMAEVLERRRLGKGTFRPQIGDSQRFFQGQAGGHDLAEQPGHFLIIEGPLVQLHDVLEHPGFTLRTVKYRLGAFGQGFLLDLRHCLSTFGTLADQFENLLVDRVNAVTQCLELVFIGHDHQPCFCSNSAM